MSQWAATPCRVSLLPAHPSKADYESGYNLRGAQIGECDAKRALAVETHEIEHKLENQLAAIRAERARPFWKFWPSRVAPVPNK